MVDKNSNIDYELISRYLAGEASTAEKDAVELWLGASEANRQSFVQLKILWEQSGKIVSGGGANVDVDSAWKRFNARLVTTNQKLKIAEEESGTRKMLHYISRVAAVLIIGAAFYLIYQNIINPFNENTQWATAHEILTDSLPDGSLISLNTHSHLSFTKPFSGDKRLVALKGEAFFHVIPNAQKPFVVKVKGAIITVLGTSFYVQAYDSLNLIKVGVAEGKVKVEAAGSDVILNTGESIAIKSGKTTLVEPYNPNDVYWRSGTLIFQNENMAAVFKALEKNYNINITIENKKILDCRLTAKFHNEKIERIFEIINTNFNLTSKVEGNHFTISGSGCN